MTRRGCRSCHDAAERFVDFVAPNNRIARAVDVRQAGQFDQGTLRLLPGLRPELTSADRAFVLNFVLQIDDPLNQLLRARRAAGKVHINRNKAIDALHDAIPRVLTGAIAEIRRRAEPIDVKVRDFLAVRGRDGKPCRVCGTTIRAVRVGDGDACFCPSCQPAARKLFVDWSKLPRG